MNTLKTKARMREDEKTTAYVLKAWESLKRSTNDCASLQDVKVASHQALYLPAGMAIPDELNGLKKDCGIEIFSLPRAIETLGDVKPEDLEVPGLLYLPNPYVVPGGRFNEMYGWDSYFIVVGLQDSGSTRWREHGR